LRRFLVALASVSAVTGTAQEPSLQPGELVRLFTVVTDSQGHLVSGLTKDDFVVLDNGKPQTITFCQSEAQPITAIVLIDRSGSMWTTFDPLVAATEQFVRGLGPQDQVRAGTFSEKVSGQAQLSRP